MATRKSRNSTRSTTSRASHELDTHRQQRAVQERSQQQIAMAAEAASAMLQVAQVWTQLQLHALQRSGDTWRIAAEQMRNARDPLELMAAHNQLAMNAFVQTLQFGQECLQAAVATQPELTRPAQEQATAAGDSVAPIMQVWQNMMNPAALNGAGTAATH